MRKKHITIICVIAGIIAIVGCIIGIFLYKTQNIGTVEFDLLGGEFNGEKSTTDNPWGTTAGIINQDDDSSLIFLTPGTQYEISVENVNRLSFEYSIFNQVKSASDGASLKLQFLDKNNIEMFSDFIEISNDDSWIEYYKEFDNVSKVIILCGSGNDGDESADWVVIKEHKENESDFGKDEYVRSITYFADEWPMNFWNSELENLDADFNQIKADGFDSIIIIIPWKEFQIKIDPIEYSDYAFVNLDKVMIAAEEHDLDVYARIGYTWDYFDDSNQYIFDRYLGVLRKDESYEAWFDYCETVYSALSKYSNFKDGFITWEDFWGCLSVCDNPDENQRIKYADEFGYQNYIKKNYKLEEYNNAYGTNYASIKDIPVPMRNDPAMESFYQFFDEFLNEILADTQKSFPNMSIEVRMDADLVTDIEGNTSFYSHAKTYKCEDSDYTATMYGIPMGFENQGERVSSDEALEHTEYILSRLLDLNDGKPVYVEQFLFYDNTPQFYYNARIKSDEVGQYLEDVSEVLSIYTAGYGIWTYRDYRSNMLYNSQFALGENGWQLGENVYVEDSEKYDSWVCRMTEGGVLAQKIPEIRNQFPEDETLVEFEIKECENAQFTISLGAETKELIIENNGIYTIVLPTGEVGEFSLELKKGNAVIDNISVYTFIQEGYLYDYTNNEQPLMENIRRLNEKLDRLR